MNDLIEVSICVPTYNQTKYLKKTLDSIASQTYKKFELIISDDSSTNDVESLIEQYKLKIPLIYVRNNPSLGSPENWNHVISIAKGNWIKIMHHDDWFCEDFALEKMMSESVKYPNSLIFAGIKGTIVHEKRSYINLPSQLSIQNIRKNPFSLIWGNIIGPPSTILFPKCDVIFDKSLIWLVDIEFYLQLLIKKNMKLVYIEDVFFENSPDDHNITNDCFQNKTLELKEFNYLFNKYYPQPTIFQRIQFMKLLHKHISSYSKISYLELVIANFKSKSK